MKKTMLLLAMAVTMLSAASVVSAAPSHFGRMAFVHHTSPSHTHHVSH